MRLTVCGNLCDICPAFQENIARQDERAALSAAWKKYLDLDLAPEDIHCPGGSCCAEGLGLRHDDCRYKPCAARHGIAHCGECPDFPCPDFDDGRKMSEEDMRLKLGGRFDLGEYDKFIRVFDNRTWVAAFQLMALGRSLAMCGFQCDSCPAYAPNVQKKDRRRELSRAWKKYYDLEIPPEKILCDGCRATGKGARLIDRHCPVRPCVLEKGIGHCGECDSYPCSKFEERRGLSSEEARKKLGRDFDPEEYRQFLEAYDNRTRLDRFKSLK
jgi:hypothetical protein